MTHREEILNYIRRNRVSTTEVADALGKSGVVERVSPITPDQHRVGLVRCVFAAHCSNYMVHDQVRHVQEGEVVLIFSHQCEDRALFGDLVSKFVLLYRNAEALVVQGRVRDLARLRRERYPIWAEGATPLGCFNTEAPPYPEEEEKQLRQQMDGGVAVCDDGGVVVIPPDRLDEDMLNRLEQIEIQEDVWYYCLNTLKWDTKKIVCEKAYLDQDITTLPTPYSNVLTRLRAPLDRK